MIWVNDNGSLTSMRFWDSSLLLYRPSGNQTWLAERYTIYYGDFPIQTPMKRSWISQLAAFEPEGSQPPWCQMRFSPWLT